MGNMGNMRGKNAMKSLGHDALSWDAIFKFCEYYKW